MALLPIASVLKLYFQRLECGVNAKSSRPQKLFDLQGVWADDKAAYITSKSSEAMRNRLEEHMISMDFQKDFKDF